MKAVAVLPKLSYPPRNRTGSWPGNSDLSRRSRPEQNGIATSNTRVDDVLEAFVIPNLPVIQINTHIKARSWSVHILKVKEVRFDPWIHLGSDRRPVQPINLVQVFDAGASQLSQQPSPISP